MDLLSTMNQTMKKQQFRLNDQAKLKVVCDDLCDNIESLLEHFGLEYTYSGKLVTMSCPIHGGDNKSALNLYPQGDVYRGNWKCRTHGCDKYFKSSIIGLVRGIISHQKYNWVKDGDEHCTFNEALTFCLEFLKKDLSDIKISNVDRDKKSFVGTIRYISPERPTEEKGITRKQIRANLKIPAQYYIDRGYSPEILDRYDVGFCDNPKKEMSNRVVVPIYDHKHQYMVGCSGRSIFEKCDKCGCCHNTSDDCPNEERSRFYSKWKHSSSFQSQNHLYNIWFAKNYILENHTVIIVESPGNVWRLEEAGIHNSVAVFGSSLSDRQKMILDASGAMTIITMMDNDDAGKKAADLIRQKCHKTYNVKNIDFPAQDVGELSIDYIKQNIVPLLK
jgi:5S rRNA maturation endonuclease (ribonuclease M5)